MLSVIVPTRNRAGYLKDTIESIFEQTLDPSRFEIIVIDNGSTDNTATLVKEIDKGLGRIRYIYIPVPGLHIGRHTGSKNARGDLLVFTDDDIIATPGWLAHINNAFTDPTTVLVGGKVLPMWEDEMPAWVNFFKSKACSGWTLGYLSLLDFGNEKKEIPASYVYGCNFSIRKSVLYKCGGFHPDGMPQELIRYRGDGETALSLAIMKKGYKSVYEPMACVYHRIPPERLTVDYFCHRAFNQGISDSYSCIRNSANMKYSPFLLHRFLMKLIVLKNKFLRLISPNKNRSVLCEVYEAYERGYAYHQAEVKSDAALLSYVLKGDYF